MVFYIFYVILGLVAGIASGLVGIGGGVIIVPSLVYLFKFSQHQAQGTTLALMVPPIGILAAWTYFKEGYVNIPVALLICLGFVLGGYFGAKIAAGIPDLMLKKIFGGVMVIMGLYMIFWK